MVLVPLAETSSRANHTGLWRTLKPVIDYSSCIRCEICWKFCPDNAINLEDGRTTPAPNQKVTAFSIPVIDYDYCKGCGICANECPEKCIEMKFEEE
ncbi:MAG: 4Fe-4S binding protein [Candidatus Thermoplasmatota archaeon]|nr:4Fe-4S binding protein [Candidatus Thermoplasmatota archaeon]